MTTLWIVISCLLFIMLLASIAIGTWMAARLTNLVYDLEDQVEESLDIIDSCYRDIGKVLDTPVFYDDPVVKQTLSSIKKAHKALLLIANKISEFSKTNLKDEKKEEKEKDSLV